MIEEPLSGHSLVKDSNKPNILDELDKALRVAQIPTEQVCLPPFRSQRDDVRKWFKHVEKNLCGLTYGR